MTGDDLTIPDDAELWRRIHPHHLTVDENPGRTHRRPSSAAFRDAELSVILVEPARDPQSAIEHYSGYYLAVITVGDARGLGLTIQRDPTPEDDAHCLVLGKKKGRADSALARAAKWVIPPPDTTPTS